MRELLNEIVLLIDMVKRFTLGVKGSRGTEGLELALNGILLLLLLLLKILLLEQLLLLMLLEKS